MRENPAYRRAIYLLTQPVTLAAITLLFLNDHLFRQLWPSWLTGKLGDFAWLFFFPLALAALLAWLIPARMPRQTQMTGAVAFGLTGVVFWLAKTLPAFHTALVEVTSRALGFEVGWRRDPSDLIALFALAAGWLFWERWSFVNPTRRQPLVRPAWVVMAATALLTVANAAQPETGIGCLRAIDDQLLACSSYSCYASTDGGLTWSTSSEQRPIDCQNWYYGQEPIGGVIQDPADPSIQYRSNPGESVERSTDGGQSWLVDYEIRPSEQAEHAYSIKTNGGNAAVFAPPLDAYYDPASGNLILAMGFTGALVRQADGTYTSVAVGKFAPERPAFGQMLFTVLSGEMILALIFGGLGIATVNLPEKKHWLRMTALVLGWLTWGATCLIFPPALQEGAYSYVFPQAGMLVAGLLALVLAVEALIRQGMRSAGLALRLGLLWLASAVLFFLPFLLWLVNILPNYTLALGFGVLLGGGLHVAIYRKAQNQFRG
jgi:hypothetical protein